MTAVARQAVVPVSEAFEWGVDSCEIEYDLTQWSDLEDLLAGQDGVTRFSSTGNGFAEFLFTVVQTSTTGLSANSIKFDVSYERSVITKVSTPKTIILTIISGQIPVRPPV